ncbi:MAG: hypothetical protein KDA85_21100, partial [Planctomycetaceae bacterium]|nr:hypothetical protein [Planctomycetaceae bacterium]
MKLFRISQALVLLACFTLAAGCSDPATTTDESVDISVGGASGHAGGAPVLEPAAEGEAAPAAEGEAAPAAEGE